MPSVHTAHTRAHTASMSSFPLSLLLSLFFSLCSVVSHHQLHHRPRALACAPSMYHKFPSIPRFSIPKKRTLLKYLSIVLNPFSSPLIAQFFLLSGILLSCVFLYFSNPIFSRMRLRPTHAPPSCAFLCMFGRRLVSRYRSGMFLPNIRLIPSLTVVYIGLHLSLSFSFFSLSFFLFFSSRYENSPVKITETHIEEHSSTTNEKVYTNKKS